MIDSVTDWFAPADDKETGVGHGSSKAEDPGVQVKVICTGPTYQPSCSGTPLVAVAVIVGFVTVGGGVDEALGDVVGDVLGEADGDTVGVADGVTVGVADGVVVSLGAAPEGEPAAMTGLTSITAPAAPAAAKTMV